MHSANIFRVFVENYSVYLLFCCRDSVHGSLDKLIYQLERSHCLLRSYQNTGRSILDSEMS